MEITINDLIEARVIYIKKKKQVQHESSFKIMKFSGVLFIFKENWVVGHLSTLSVALSIEFIQ